MNSLERKILERFPQESISVIHFTIMKEKATVLCNTCNTEYTLVRAENFIRNTKTCICKKCNNNRSGGRLTIEDFQKRIDEKYTEEKLQVLSYTLRNEPCKIKCLICGNINELQNAESYMNKDKKVVCKKCHHNKEKIIEQSYNKFKEWINTQSKYSFFPLPKKINSNTLILAKCKECNTINKKTIYDYMRGRGCGICQKNTLKTVEEYQNEIGEEYTILEYKGMEHQAKIKHNLCGFIYSKNARHFSCPICSGSKGEKAIRFLLEKHNVIFEEQKTYIINGHKLRVDFYIPDKDIIIEYQGEQHYRPIGRFGGELSFKKQQLYDNYKRDFYKDKLIEIPYYDYDNIETILNFLF